MSGSSLDGLDIACCQFIKDDKWSFRILNAETVPYPEDWLLRLKNAVNLSAEELVRLDVDYGKYIGDCVKIFIESININPSMIASHGHTVFHNPDKGYTLQIGNGQAIAHVSGVRTINDFRTGDVVLGGQGAPLVPIGDNLLFHDYNYCINLGGIANISYPFKDRIIAFDICPANQMLNYLSNQFGEPMDKDGRTAALGKLDKDLFDKLNSHTYYKMSPPKSMSNQDVSETFLPVLEQSLSSVEDKLYTVCKHIAFQINQCINVNRDGEILITGGGAHNSFLVNAIKMETGKQIIIPDKQIIDYKEALIFAFMGLLRSLDKINVYSSVTGASEDSSQGLIHNP